MFACNDKYYEEKMHFVKSLNILDHISSCVPLEFTYYSQMLYMNEQISEQIQFLSTATLTTTYLFHFRESVVLFCLSDRSGYK